MSEKSFGRDSSVSGAFSTSATAVSSEEAGFPQNAKLLFCGSTNRILSTAKPLRSTVFVLGCELVVGLASELFVSSATVKSVAVVGESFVGLHTSSSTFMFIGIARVDLDALVGVSLD